MPLQNRVDPFGDIHAVASRGLFMGNRGGMLHDAATRTLSRRRWVSKAWIICLCAFKGRRRRVMGPGSYTELFFLDEATALSAGHRPCFECRRDAAREFAACFAAANGLDDRRAGAVDALLHSERTASRRDMRPLPGDPRSLPDGAMVADGPEAYLVHRGRLLRWGFAGYTAADDPPAGLSGPRLLTPRLNTPRLLTPPATVQALAAGFRPMLHPSAAEAA